MFVASILSVRTYNFGLFIVASACMATGGALMVGPDHRSRG